MKPETARKLHARWLQSVERGRPVYLLTRVPLFFLILLVAGAGCIFALEGSFTLLIHRPLLLSGLIAWLALISVLIPIWQYRLVKSAIDPQP